MIKIKSIIIIIFIFSVTTLSAKKPIFVNFTILGAIVAPNKITGKNWDISIGLNQTVGNLVSDMVIPGSGLLASAAISVIGKDAAKGKSAPDVIGYIVQTGPTTKKIGQKAFTPLVLSSRNYNFTKDSYIPSFNTGYNGWPIFENTRFRIKLWDKDFSDNDNIGTVELNIDDIKKAIKAKKPIWINVADQSQNQLLFISLSATKTNEKATSFIDGYKW